MKINFKELYNNPRIVYVALNISISGLSFVRSFISIRYLDFYELGLVGILQILIMIISMLQLGMVTGGYNALSVFPKNRNINNTVFSYLLVMVGISLPVITSIAHSDSSPLYITLAGILIGAVLLYNNWLTCMMLAKGDIKSLNTINLISALVSFLTVPAIVVWKLYGVLLGTAIAPLLFCITAMLKAPYLRPSRFTLGMGMIKKLLYYGIGPYMTSTFLYLNIQIERWAVVKVLGVEELGRLSLCVLISTAFMIVPASISNLYFPTAIKSFAERDFPLFKSVMKRFAWIIVSYSTASVIAIALLIHLLVPLFFPKHIPQIPLVYWMLPSLFFTGIKTILSVVFNSAFKYRAIITVNIISLLGMLAGVICIIQSHGRQLYYFVAIESIVAFISFICAFGIYMNIRKKMYIQTKHLDNKDAQNQSLNIHDISQ